MATGTNIGSLFWTTGLETSGLQRDSKKAQGALSGLFKPSILGAVALTAAILKAGDAALSFARDFETAFAEVQTISQSARENAESMRETLLRMTTEVPVGAVDASRALYQIVSAGIDGAAAMKVLEVSAKAAVAGVSTTAVAADTLTTIINAYGLSADEVTKVSDALFKTVELGKTTLSELGGSFSQVAGLAAAYNIELNDVLAATAQLTVQGASTSEAITRIRGGIVALSKEFGPAVFEGRNLAEAFQFARDEADKAGKGYEEFFGRVEAVVGILGLTGERLDDYNEKLKKVTESEGSTDAALEIMNSTFDAQAKLLKNNLTVAFSGFGDLLKNSITPIILGLNKALSDDGPTKQINQTTKEVNTLVTQLTDLNTSEDDRKTIIAEINKLYPELLKGLSDEEIATANLTERLKEFNLEQINRIVIAKEQAKIDESITKKNELLVQQREKDVQLTEDIATNIKAISTNEFLSEKLPEEQQKLLDILLGQGTATEKLRDFQSEISEIISENRRRSDQITKGTTETVTALFEYSQIEKEIEKTSEGINDLTAKRDEIAKSLGIKTKEEEGSIKRRIAQIDKLNKSLLAGPLAGKGVKKSIINLENLENELKKLKESLSKATAKDAVEIFVKITAKETEIEDFIKKIEQQAAEEPLNIPIDPIITPRVKDLPIELTGLKDLIKPSDTQFFAGIGFINLKKLKDANKEVKKLNDKIKEGAKDAKKLKEELAGATKEAQEEFRKFGSKVTEIVDATNFLIDDLGEIVGLTEEQSENLQDSLDIVGGIADIFSGQIIQGATKIIASLVKLLFETPEKLSERFVNLNKNIEKVVSSLNIASESLSNLGQSNITITLALISSQLDKIKDSANNLNDELEDNFYGKRRGQGTNVVRDFGELVNIAIDLNAEIEELSERLIQGGISDDQREAIEAVLNSYNILLNQIDSITQEITGTTAIDLSNALSEAFLAGEQAAESWGETVDDIIKNVIIKQLAAQVLSKPITEAINQLVKDTERGLTVDEAQRFKDAIQNISESVAPAFEEARKALEELGINIGGAGADETGLAGAIRREITEETAGLILGQFSAFRVDMRLLNDITANHTEILTESAGYLQQIALNTENNAALPQIVTELQELNTNIKNQIA